MTDQEKKELIELIEYALDEMRSPVPPGLDAVNLMGVYARRCGVAQSVLQSAMATLSK